MKPTDLAYDAAAEWKSRALKAETESKRLRESLSVEQDCAKKRLAELREAIRAMSVNEGKLQARLANMETDPTAVCANELLEMRAWRDRVRAAFEALRAAYYHEDNVCGEILRAYRRFERSDPPLTAATAGQPADRRAYIERGRRRQSASRAHRSRNHRTRSRPAAGAAE